MNYDNEELTLQYINGIAFKELRFVLLKAKNAGKTRTLLETINFAAELKKLNKMAGKEEKTVKIAAIKTKEDDFGKHQRLIEQMVKEQMKKQLEETMKQNQVAAARLEQAKTNQVINKTRGTNYRTEDKRMRDDESR